MLRPYEGRAYNGGHAQERPRSKSTAASRLRASRNGCATGKPLQLLGGAVFFLFVDLLVELVDFFADFVGIFGVGI